MLWFRPVPCRNRLALRNGHIRCTRAMMKHYTSLLFALLMAPSAWSQGYAELDISGVRARFLANGDVARDTQNSIAQFEVPQGGGVSANYFAGLWIGGAPLLGQMRFAGSLYGQDSSLMFFPGPLTVDGTASTTQLISEQFDQVWKIDRADVALHLAYYNCVSDPNCDVAAAFPSGYSIPAEFLDWPAHGPDAAMTSIWRLFTISIWMAHTCPPMATHRAYLATRRSTPSWRPPEPTLRRLANGNRSTGHAFHLRQR